MKNNETQVQDYPEQTYWRSRYDPATMAHRPSEWDNARYLDFGNTVLALVRDRLRPADRILDFGCGDGRFKGALAPQAKEYYACDLAADPGGIVTPCNGVDVPFPGVTFDLVWCCVVLQHVVDDAIAQRLLLQLAERVRPGGRMILIENTTLQQPGHEHVAFRTSWWYALGLRRGGLSTPQDRRVEFTHGGEQYCLLEGIR